MQRSYYLFPEDILKVRTLKNPRYGKSKKKNEPQFLDFSPTYTVILMSLISLLTPYNNKVKKKEITYKDISDSCGVPIPTIKEKMPVIRHNFPYYFNVIEKKFGKGFTYKLNPNFAKELINAYEEISQK